MNRSVKYFFIALLVVFALIVSEVTVPAVRTVFKGKIFLLPFIVFALLGIVLVILLKKSEVEGKLRRSLYIAGGSAVGIVVFMVMHNLFYALRMTINKTAPVIEFLGGTSFILSIIILPLVFILSAVRVLIGFRK